MSVSMFRVGITLSTLLPGLAFAQTTVAQSSNLNAIIMFLIFVALSLAITYWSAGRTK